MLLDLYQRTLSASMLAQCAGEECDKLKQVACSEDVRLACTLHCALKPDSVT